MGKPSHPNIQSSKHSLNSSNLQATMSSTKKRKNKNRKNKQQKLLTKSIQKLFNNLRTDIETPSTEEFNLNESASNVTVITIEDSHLKTPVSKKRKLLDEQNDAPKIPKHENNLIIIQDNDFKTPQKSPPINCSTPKSTLKPPSECDISNVCDLTKEINSNSYLTIDLTTETLDSTGASQNTVIDLEAENSLRNNSDQNTVIDLEKPDCSLLSVSAGSMSGDSDVTVISKGATDRRMQKFAKGIANLNAVEKGKLLELITQNIFNGCNVTSSSSSIGLKNTLQAKQSRATETVEDAYIKEVILGQSQSRNSIGSNIYNPVESQLKQTPLRMIVIDGSNVALGHGMGKYFSVKGLKICIEYFVKRGHIVKAFVPRFRCKFGKSTEPRLLDALEKQGLVVYTPSREVQGKLITSYDDRYIVQCAAEFDGVIVSGDNFRDLLRENPRWRFVIENRLLPFTWVEDMIMFPRDPLGRNGPTLERMLKRV